MAGIFATDGSKIYIGGAVEAKSADWVEGDFDAQSWTEISWLENIGAFGDEASEVTFDAIGEKRTQKLKGVRNAGNMELAIGIAYADSGQIALKAAETVDDDYAFKVEFDDAPGGGTASLRYFIGKVMTAREALDSANSVMRLNATIAINSNIVQVDAA